MLIVQVLARFGHSLGNEMGALQSMMSAMQLQPATAAVPPEVSMAAATAALESGAPVAIAPSSCAAAAASAAVTGSSAAGSAPSSNPPVIACH